MPLSQKEIRDRAYQFASEWAAVTRERAEAQTFWNEFFNIFGFNRRRIASFEEPVKKLGDRRGSIVIVYNNFPWPEAPTDKQQAKVEQCAQAVLDARAAFPDSTLADLYDPNSMPKRLLSAHQVLDTAVDACYRSTLFKTELERLEFLFALYRKYTEPLAEMAKQTGKTQRRSKP